MNEQETINIINNKFKTNFTLKEDKYCDYDAEDKNYICEIKNRRKYYKDKIIECVKLFKNYRHSNIIKKIFIYVVTDENGIYVYNINKYIDKILLNKPIKKNNMPVNTDFGSSVKITKYCYTLKEDISVNVKMDL